MSDLAVLDASPVAVRSFIDSLTREMVALPADGELVQLTLRVEHTVQDGMYMRKLFIPKGALLVGKIHLKSCINIVACGDISVLTEHGMRRLSPGFTGVSHAGIQKVGKAHENTIFINIFRTDMTDIADIEREIAEDPPAIKDLACL